MFLNCMGDLSWWVELVQTDAPILCTNHSFQKQCALSQYTIYGPNGLVQSSIPLERETRKGPYRSVEIAYRSKWTLEQWRGIEAAYRKSPFFMYYDFRIQPVFMEQYQTLFAFNVALFEQIRMSLKWKKNVMWNHSDAVNYQQTATRKLKAYPQVFDDRFGFQPEVCILDLLFNLGPESLDYLMDQA